MSNKIGQPARHTNVVANKAVLISATAIAAASIVALAYTFAAPPQAAVKATSFVTTSSPTGIVRLSAAGLDSLLGARFAPIRSAVTDQGNSAAQQVAVMLGNGSGQLSDDGNTLFSATRTDTNLGSLQVDAAASGDDVLGCGGESCPVLARHGEDLTSNDDKHTQLAWPAEPVMILTGQLSAIADGADDASGDYAIVAHRGGTAAGGEVSLFVRCPAGTNDVCERGEANDSSVPDQTAVLESASL